MGRTDSSSRTKYSKKKSSKVSSEGYRKKKSRRNKSKKLRHHDDSFSSCSDDESTSSSLNSSSGSEGEYKRKQVRSRSRSEIKGNKKRNRRRSLSEDTSEDSSPVKKRKRSKNAKKIKKKKKKSKRVAYLSSASSDSGSCSTCKYEDSSGDQLGSHGGSRGRSREKRKDRRDSTKARTGNRKNMSKTRSSVSPCSSDELGSQGRSRSKSRENKEGHRDSTKGRTGNRMNTSKDVSSFSPSRSYGSESMEKVTVENNLMRLKSVITVANLDNKEDDKNDEFKEETVYDYDDYPSSKSNDSVELVDRLNSSADKTSVVKEVNSSFDLNDNMEKESNVSGNIISEVDNLELILRQKALENLSKFRGGNKSKPTVLIDDKPKNDQSVVTESTLETASMTPLSQPVTHRSRFTWRREPSVTTAKDEKAATYSELHSCKSKPAELKLQTENLSSTSRVDNEFVNETSKIMANTTNVDQKSTVAVETQTPSSASIEEGSSKEQQNEGNDNSQFEKKTMSVMRGGEMVQVSYKVYIPNRAPALARRQLKR